MNANQLVNMFFRIVARKFMNRGIDAGINAYSRRGKKNAGAGTEAPLSPEEKQRAQEARKMAQKARQGAKLVRRMGRFR